MSKPPCKGKTSGFTLLELLVVLLIIGITVTFIGLSVNTRTDDLDQAARRLAALINLAQDEAVLNGREYALQFDGKGGYLFLELGEQDWREVADDDVLKPRRLPEGMEVTLTLEGETVSLAAAGEGAVMPRIYLLSSGEATHYEITLQDGYSETRRLILAGEDGTARVEVGAERG